MFPSPSTALAVGDAITIGVTVTNTSTTTDTNANVAAELRACGTMRVKLACLDSDCAVENPGLLTFVNCTNLAVGVDTCGLDPTDVSGNTILITMNGTTGVDLAAGATQLKVADIQATVA